MYSSAIKYYVAIGGKWGGPILTDHERCLKYINFLKSKSQDDMYSITSFRLKSKLYLENGQTNGKMWKALGLDNLGATELPKIPLESC